jgi:general L-amino acid transport system substrate-binding protein
MNVMTSTSRDTLLAAALLIGALAGAHGSAAAGYTMCALRSGPEGPCTCRAPDDGVGQFTTVDRSYCRRAAKAAKGKPAAEKPTVAGDVAGDRGPAAQNPPEQSKASASGKSLPSAAVVPTTSSAAAPTEAPAAAPAAVAPPAAGLTTSALPSARLDAVRARGKLLCGVNPGLLGFAHRTATGEWSGIDADFCRAVAIATLGDAGKVEFVPLDAAERFEALKAGRIDLLSRNTTWTMNRDVDMGLEFVGVLYFDGQGFMTKEERGLVSAQQLAGSKVCVLSATTSEKNMGYYFGAQRIDAETRKYASREELVKAYLEGVCDAYSADRSALFSDRAGFAEPLAHVVLPEVISKEPLGPAVLQGDQEWTEIVRWTLAGLVNAEEVGLDRAAASASQTQSGDALRLLDGAAASGERLRLDKGWLRSVVAGVGHYGEMFDVNVGKASPLGMDRGINALWKKGGILYAPPMW